MRSLIDWGRLKMIGCLKQGVGVKVSFGHNCSHVVIARLE